MRSEDASERPRYSELPLPPYSYVPGFAPHPVSDPRGHMHGQSHVAPPPLRPEAWRESEPYLYGVDLFNHGFYWEAHEAWESLWHAAGRRGPVATWLKALIKLAAAGVKAREGNAAGAARHAQRSLELVGETRAELAVAQESYCGMAICDVEDAGQGIVADAAKGYVNAEPELLLPYFLSLSAASSSSPAR